MSYKNLLEDKREWAENFCFHYELDHGDNAQYKKF